MGGKGSGKPKGCKNKDQSRHWTPEKKKAWSKEYYLKHREHYIKYNAEYRRTHKEKLQAKYQAYKERGLLLNIKRLKINKVDIISYYSNGTMKCLKCGFDDIRALQIDHINGGGTKHRRELGRTGDAFYRWLRLNNYPEGYQVLCCNCNWIKRFENKEKRK